MKKIIAFVLVLCMLAPCLGQSVYAAETGSCGDNVTWTYESGTLTLSGTGETFGDVPYWFWGGKIYSVTRLVVEPGITGLGKGIFNSFNNLTQIVLPETLTTLGEGAFSGCGGLKEITLPEGLTTIGVGAFFDCRMLEKIVLPSTLTTVGDRAFYNTALTKVVFPEGLTRLGNDVFQKCEYLVSVTFPATVKEVGNSLFQGCLSLQELVFRGDAPAFSAGTFQDTTVTVFYPAGNTTWDSVTMNNYGGLPYWYELSEDGLHASGKVGTGITWKVDGTVLTVTGSDNAQWPIQSNYYPWEAFDFLVTDLVLENMTSIPDKAFHHFTALTSITWPKKLTKIGSEAFTYCKALKKVHIPETVETIGSQAFSYCESLTDVKLPSGLQTLAKETFRNCSSLRGISLPKGLKYINDGVFRYSGLRSLIIPGTVKHVSQVLFEGCSELRYVVLREGVESIGFRTFDYCRRLEYITFPKSLKDMGQHSFWNTGGETLVFLGGKPKNINYSSGPIYYSKNRSSWDGYQGLHSHACDDPQAMAPVTPTAITGPVNAVRNIANAFTVYCEVPSGTTRTVRIPLVNPDYGNVFVKIGKDGSETVLSNTIYTEDGAQVTLEKSATVAVVNRAKSFPDVPNDYWAKKEIDYMSARGYIMGKRDGTYCPGETITRGTVAMLLWRMEGSPKAKGSCPFTDVKQDIYYDAILWAYEAGVITGYTDGTFRADGQLTRQHLAAMLHRYAKYIEFEGDTYYRETLPDFSDYDRIYGWAREACQWAVDNGLIQGRADGTFDPQGNASRAQLSVILCRFLQQINQLDS